MACAEFFVACRALGQDHGAEALDSSRSLAELEQHV